MWHLCWSAVLNWDLVQARFFLRAIFHELVVAATSLSDRGGQRVASYSNRIRIGSEIYLEIYPTCKILAVQLPWKANAAVLNYITHDSILSQILHFGENSSIHQLCFVISAHIASSSHRHSRFLAISSLRPTKQGCVSALPSQCSHTATRSSIWLEKDLMSPIIYD